MSFHLVHCVSSSSWQTIVAHLLLSKLFAFFSFLPLLVKVKIAKELFCWSVKFSISFSLHISRSICSNKMQLWELITFSQFTFSFLLLCENDDENINFQKYNLQFRSAIHARWMTHTIDIESLNTRYSSEKKDGVTSYELWKVYKIEKKNHEQYRHVIGITRIFNDGKSVSFSHVEYNFSRFNNNLFSPWISLQSIKSKFFPNFHHQTLKMWFNFL